MSTETKYGQSQRYHVCRKLTTPVGWPGREATKWTCTKTVFPAKTAWKVVDVMKPLDKDGGKWGILEEKGSWARFFSAYDYMDDSRIMDAANAAEAEK